MTPTVLPGMMHALATKGSGESIPDPAPAAISLFQYGSRISAPASKSMITLEQHLFSFIMEGEKKVWLPGSSTTIGDGEFILLSGGNCLMTEKVSASGNYKSILLFFDTQMLQDFFIKHPAIAARPIAAKHPPAATHSASTFIRFRKDAFIRHYTGSLQQVLSAGLGHSPQMLRIKLEELFLYLSEKYPAIFDSFPGRRAGAPGEMEIRRAVEANLDKNITLGEMAFLCNVSLSTFKRRFTKIYGNPPNKWILHRKMEIAASLLRDRGTRPGEVAYQIGYKNPSSFTQAFKQVHGVTPGVFQTLDASR